MGTTAAAPISHLGWSRWFHCESSFELSLVPRKPGLFAVGRKEDPGNRLHVLRVEATADLFHELSQLFTANCPLRGQFEKGECLLRYVCVPDVRTRQVALAELQAWLAAPGESRSTVVDEFLHREFGPFRGRSD